MRKKSSKKAGQSIGENRRYHERYLRAINNPLRRKILRVLKEGDVTIEDIKLKTGLNDETLNWHLTLLENGACVEKDTRQGKLVYRLTQEGRVVDYME